MIQPLVGLSLCKGAPACAATVYLTPEQARYLAQTILVMIDVASDDNKEDVFFLPEDNEGSLGGMVFDKDDKGYGIEVETENLGDVILVAGYRRKARR